MEQLLHISHIYITVWTQQVCLPCNPEMLVGYLCQPGLPYLLSPWESYTFMAHLSSLHWSLRTLMMTSSSSHNHLSSPLWRFCPFVIFSRLLQKSWLDAYHKCCIVWYDIYNICDVLFIIGNLSQSLTRDIWRWNESKTSLTCWDIILWQFVLILVLFC